MSRIAIESLNRYCKEFVAMYFKTWGEQERIDIEKVDPEEIKKFVVLCETASIDSYLITGALMSEKVEINLFACLRDDTSENRSILSEALINEVCREYKLSMQSMLDDAVNEFKREKQEAV